MGLFAPTKPDEEANNGVGCLLLLILAIVVLAAMSAPFAAMPDVTLRDHAVERHGADAWKAREANMHNGHKFSCKNGKEYYISKTSDGKFAITVVANGVEITSFVTSRKRFVENALNRDECTGPSWIWLGLQ